MHVTRQESIAMESRAVVATSVGRRREAVMEHNAIPEISSDWTHA